MDARNGFLLPSDLWHAQAGAKLFNRSLVALSLSAKTRMPFSQKCLATGGAGYIIDNLCNSKA